MNSVSQLSHVFYRFASKYLVSNFIEDRPVSGSEPVSSRRPLISTNDFNRKRSLADLEPLAMVLKPY